MMVLSSCYFTHWLHPRVMLMKHFIIHRGFLSAERSTILHIILMSGGEFTSGIGIHFEPHVEQGLERQIVDFRHIRSSLSLAKAERPPVSRCQLEVSRGKARTRQGGHYCDIKGFHSLFYSHEHVQHTHIL